MEVINGVLRRRRQGAVKSLLKKHGWRGGKPPKGEEKEKSLDWLGGGELTFGIQLEPVAPGPLRRLRILPQTTHLGFCGWKMSDTRASLLIDTLTNLPGWTVSSLGLEEGNEDFIWWLDSQAGFDEGASRLRNPLKRAEDFSEV